jgi:hypothetical protein
MEAMREAWTDERLDDLTNRMDRGFDRVDVDLRELKAEHKAFRGEVAKEFGKIDDKFERVHGRLDSIQRTIAMGAIVMTAAFIAGFGALVGLVATQL